MTWKYTVVHPPSDDQYLRLRSQFGFSAQEANLIEIRVGAETTVNTPALLDLSVECRLNTPGGLTRVRLRNWSTNRLDQIHQYSIGTAEFVEQVLDLPAPDYVRPSDSRIELFLRQSVVATFSASGFESRFDHVRIEVR